MRTLPLLLLLATFCGLGYGQTSVGAASILSVTQSPGDGSNCRSLTITVRVTLNNQAFPGLGTSAFYIAENGGSERAPFSATFNAAQQVYNLTTNALSGANSTAITVRVFLIGTIGSVINATTGPFQVSLPCNVVVVTATLNCATKLVTVNATLPNFLDIGFQPASRFRVYENGVQKQTTFTPPVSSAYGPYVFTYNTAATSTAVIRVDYVTSPGSEFPSSVAASGTGSLLVNCGPTVLITNSVNNCPNIRVDFQITAASSESTNFTNAFALDFFEASTKIPGTDLIELVLDSISGNQGQYHVIYRTRVQNASTFNFDVLVTQLSTNLQARDSRQLNSCLSSAPTASCPANPPMPALNQPYSFTPTVTGGSIPFSWNYVSQTTDLDRITGAPVVISLTGATTVTFKQTGPARVTLRVSDSLGRSSDATCTFTVNSTLTLSCNELDTVRGIANQSYGASVLATGGISPYTFSLTNVTGSVFSIEPATGRVTGTPQSSGNLVVNVGVTDKSTPAQQQPKQCTIQINPAVPPAPIISCGTIGSASATVGQPYTGLPGIQPNTGMQPFRWAFAAQPAAPSWLSMNQSSGLVSGTPPSGTTAGTVTIGLQVTDSASPARTSPTQNCSFQLNAAPIILDPKLNLSGGTVSTTNATATVQLAAAAPVNLSGNLTITFVPDSGANISAADVAQPNFVSGSLRTLMFTMASGTQRQDFPIQPGTVAGTATVSLTRLVNDAGVSQLGATAQTQIFTIAKTRPVILSGSVSLELTAPSGCTAATGATAYVFVKNAFSTTRDVTGGAIEFALTSGKTAATATSFAFDTALIGNFSSWFSSPAGKQNGGSFGFCLPVTLSNGAFSDIANVSVTLNNSATPGVSDKVSWK